LSPQSKNRQQQHLSTFIRGILVANLWLIFIISALIPSLMYPASVMDQESLDNNKVIRNADANNRNTYLEKVIFDELINDPRVSPYGLTVEVDNGEVILKGLVNNLFGKQAAEENIKNKLGVRHVKNLIQVNRKPQKISDTEISSMLNEIINSNPYTYRYEISVFVSKGKVKLSGIVSNSFERDQAEQAAACVEGITTVDNMITVSKNYIFNTNNSLKQTVENDPVLQSIINSYYKSNGLNSHLTFSIDNNYWIKSLAENNIPQDQMHIYGNPETGRYEYFNFVGLFMFMIKTIINE